jgi:uncharacterized protein
VGNAGTNPHVGLLSVDFEGGSRLRMNGIASIDVDDLAATYPGAALAERVETRELSANCRRYIHRCQLVGRSPFVPADEVDPPVPDWKLARWLAGTLPGQGPGSRSRASPRAFDAAVPVVRC